MSAVPGPPGQPNQPGPAVPVPGASSQPPVAQSTGVPTGVPGPYEHKTPWTAYIKPVIWTLVALWVIGFVFLNTTTVAINFIFFKAEVALIFVLVGMALIGAGLCAGVMVMTRRRSTKKAELAQAKSQLAAAGKKK